MWAQVGFSLIPMVKGRAVRRSGWILLITVGCTAGTGKRNLVFMTMGPFSRTEDCLEEMWPT